MENFIRRFANSATLNKTYTINFYSIYETPPAVSIEILTNTNHGMAMGTDLQSGVVTRLSAILEVNGYLDI